MGQVYGKAEFLNPGGSVKDRVAAKIVEEVSDLGCANFICWKLKDGLRVLLLLNITVIVGKANS